MKPLSCRREFSHAQNTGRDMMTLGSALDVGLS